MLTVTSLTKSFGGRTLLSDVSFRLLPKEKIGFIGPNGSGKTTLLRIIAGQEPYDSGSVLFEEAGLKVSLLSQLVTLKPYNRVSDEMRLATGEIASIEAQLRIAEEEMTSLSDDPEALDRAISAYGALQEKYDNMRGGDIDWEIDKILQGLGFSLSDKDRFVSEFSGGWKMRLEFAKLLLRKSDILMLDEPTNHLDMQAIQWLEDYLASYPGALIIVSHDRYFLNRVTSKTIALSNTHIKQYAGNYDFYLKQKVIDEELEYKRYKEQQKIMEHDLRFIERFRYKATLASRVKSREKMTEKRELIAAPAKKSKTVHVNFDYDEKQMTRVFYMKDILKDFGSVKINYSGEKEINAGDKIAFVGPNGCGKTTLLNILANQDKKYEGRLKIHPAAVIKYYRQNQSSVLCEDNTVMGEMERIAPFGMTVTEIRTRLAAFLFFGDEVFKKVSVLSGGERARLSLAMMLCSSCNVLILDEPTNHLDIDSREALAVALNDFEGTVIIVSHDRYFIDQICTGVMEIDGSKIEYYPGNYSWYRAKKQQNERKAALLESTKDHEEVKKSVKVTNKSSSKNNTISPMNLKKMIAKKEAEIEKAEKRLKTIESLLSDNDILSDTDKLSKLSSEYGDLSKEIERLYDEYAELA